MILLYFIVNVSTSDITISAYKVAQKSSFPYILTIFMPYTLYITWLLRVEVTRFPHVEFVIAEHSFTLPIEGSLRRED